MAEPIFDLLVLGDFLNGRTGRPRDLHKDDLDAFLASSAPTTRNGGMRFTTFRDFRPDALVDRNAPTRALADLRDQLREVATGRRSAPDLLASLGSLGIPAVLADRVRQALNPSPDPATAPTPPTSAGPQAAAPAPAAPAPVAPADPDDPLAAIFAQVDVGGSIPAASVSGGVTSALDRLLSGIVGRSSTTPPRGAAEALREVESALGAATLDLLREPEFRALESSWLGLRFLLKRVDHRAGVHVHLLPTTASELTTTLRDLALPYADEIAAEGRTFCLLADFDLKPETLAEIAPLLEASSTTLLAGLDPTPLGLSGSDLLSAPDIAAKLDECAEWKALRSTPAARWVGLTVNRFLVRAPFGPRGEVVKGNPVEESEGDLPFARGIWPLGERIAASAARTGWGLECLGAGAGGLIENLPLRPLISRSGDEVACCLESSISEQRLLELSRSGLIALATARNADHAFFGTAPVLFAPRRGSDDRAYAIDARRATLPYQLMVAQVMNRVRQVLPHIDAAHSARAIADTLAGGLKLLFLSPSGPLFNIEVTSPTAGQEEATTIGIRLTPVLDPMRGLPDFELELGTPGRQ
ncbi:MAG: type VI secretion system contractile sheath large subunit [Candidatus Eisenbacteria bacterium]|nr:type VI secretion system contractile sheath large subunit [Candidatus Eisenbacteria bacterium]